MQLVIPELVAQMDCLELLAALAQLDNLGRQVLLDLQEMLE